MIFGSAMWLWLGLGVLIPVFIHLWNKMEKKPRLLGTFRFLPEESRAAASRIELHEIPLLLIRIGIVILVMLLLAELFWQKELEPIQRISIQEVKDGEQTWTNGESGITTLQIPTENINRHGWWNILQQVEHEYLPEYVTVDGDFTQDRFKGNRPSSTASVSWNRVDSLQLKQKTLATWLGKNEKGKSLTQLKTENEVVTCVVDLEGEETLSAEVITLVTNSENAESINTGLRYAAEMLSIPVEERVIPNIAQVEIGESILNLVGSISKNGIQERVEPNSWTGVSFNISDLDTQKVFVESFIETESEKPFFGLNSAGDFIINGQVEPELVSWVYAGIGRALLQHSLKVGESLYPVMEENQLMVNKSTGAIRSAVQPHSARNWLFGLLLLFWAVERMIAPRRGM